MENTVMKLLVMCQGGKVRLDMTQLMTYCLTPVPYCNCTADGILAKTNKNDRFSFLTNDTMDVSVQTMNVLTIEDGNALFEIKVKQVTEKLYSSIVKCGDSLLSTDMHLTTSVKALERSEEDPQTN